MKKTKSGLGKTGIKPIKRKTLAMIIGLLVVVAAGVYVWQTQFSADSASATPLTGITKCQYNMKTGCNGFFQAVKKNDAATKSYLSSSYSGADKIIRMSAVNSYVKEANNVTKIALKTKDLNQCLAMQNTCSTYKVNYKALVDKKEGTFVDNLKTTTPAAVQAPKKVTEKPITKLPTDASKKYKACQKSLAKSVSVIKKNNSYVKSKSGGVRALFGNNTAKDFYSGITLPASEAAMVQKTIGRMNNIDICNNALAEMQAMSNDYREGVYAGDYFAKNLSATVASNPSWQKDATEWTKLRDKWNATYKVHVAKFEKILNPNLN